MMISYLDLAILSVLIWGAWKGLRSGGINVLAGWAGYILGLVVAGSFASPLAVWLDSTWRLGQLWGPKLAQVFPLPQPVLAQNLAPAARQQVQVYLEGLFLPASIRERLSRFLLEAAAGGQATVGQALGGYLVLVLLKMALAVFLFFLTLRVLRGLAAFLSRTIGFTPLGPLNRITGLILGGGTQAVWLALILGLLVLPFLQWGPLRPGPGDKIGQALNHSFFVKPLEGLYVWLMGLLHNFF